MTEFKTNMFEVLDAISEKLSSIELDRITRLQASSVMAVMRDRIHVQGRDASGSQIGIYTPAYVKYTRNKPKYGRGTSSKVILSLTRTMENAWMIYPIEGGTGIGFTTSELLQRSQYCEETYSKKIFEPTAEERRLAEQIAYDYIKEKFS